MGHLECRNLYKSFGEVEAVKDVSFEVKDKEFAFLLGPTGAGKTTTLRMIAGLETPDSGEVVVDGEDITSLPPESRSIAMVFQTWGLFPNMNVYQNISFPLRIRKVDKTEIDKRVKEITEMLSISHLVERKPSELSGGESQRVAVGRALAFKASIYLLDEALTFLDAKLREAMRAELRILQKTLGITILMVTHDQIEAMTMGDKIGVFTQAQILQWGTPSELYSDPQDTFIANFVGSPGMNLLEGEITAANGKHVFNTDYMKRPISQKLMDGVTKVRGKDWKELILGIRPEKMEFVTKTTGIPGKIEVIEDEGARLVVDVLAGEKLLKVISSVAKLPRTKEKVFIDWKDEDTCLFDGRTNRRIL
jgi:multiple sugar transport system ATP-binding protein